MSGECRPCCVCGRPAECSRVFLWQGLPAILCYDCWDYLIGVD